MIKKLKMKNLFSLQFYRFILSITIIIITVVEISGQNNDNDKINPINLVNQDTYSNDINGTYLETSLQWREIGPNRGGRACSVIGIESNPLIYYAGYTGGGVWKTTNAGISWENISDGYFGGSIGAVAVSQKNPNILYVGEGEKTIRGDVSTGHGMWKSVDAGKSWQHIGLKNSMLIGRIRIHPNNPDIVYVAVIGNLWKASKDRGVYKTTDGGKTWNKILYSNEQAGAIDLILDPSNPEIIYATTYRVQRNGYRLDSGGEGSHLWKSKDGGNTWNILSNNPGMPNGILGNIGVAVSPSNPNRIWAIVESKQGGLYRSDDAGKTWKQTSDFVELFQKAYYYMRVYADPKDQDKVHVLNTRYHTSTDGGYTFESKRGPHVDHHDMWINPKNPNYTAMAADGGVPISLDGMKSWSSIFNQPTAQIYRVSADNHFPFRLYGGQQDWGAIRISHLAEPDVYNGRTRNQSWEDTAGGESGYVVADPDNSDIVYGGTYKGYMMRKDHNSNQMTSVNVWPVNPAGWGVEVMKYRFNWNYPVFFSPHNNNKLYAASNYLHVSTDEGQSWKVISPDLTKGDPETLKSSGGPISQDNTGVEYYGTIITAIESPYEKDIIWTGSDDGFVHVSKNGGEQWNNVTPTSLPQNAMINDISVHPFKKGGVYIAATAYKFGNYKPYLYQSLDYGETWTKIDNGLPDDYFTRTIEADTKRKGLLYAGTEWGIFVSFDDGKNWKSFQLNLPIVSIRDLLVKDDKLIAATHGRGFWIIDDLAVLRQVSDKIDSKKVYLFKPSDSYRPGKVQFSFFSKEKSNLELKIFDENNDLVNKFKFSDFAGSKLYEWDMRYPGFDTFEGMHFYSSPNRGPITIPGIYTASLKMGNDSVSQKFKILKDPRISVSQTDLEKQLDYLLLVRNKVSEANGTVAKIKIFKAEINRVLKKVKNPSLKRNLRKLNSEVISIENELQNVKIIGGRDPLKYGVKLNNRLAFLLADSQRGAQPPTKQSIEVFGELSDEFNILSNKLELIFSKRLDKLNKRLEKLDIPIVKVQNSNR